MSSRSNYLLLVEYDGAGFSGWQAQPGERTVQGELEKALLKLGFGSIKTVAAGRTDKGVHAAAQAVSVSFVSPPAYNDDLRYRLNSVLPKDISISLAQKKDSSFNPRYEAKNKTYRYYIWNMPWRSVWNDRNSWHIREKLNIRLMRKAAKFITGRHDFSAFDASGSTQENKTACISSIKITRREGKLSLAFTGDRFLYKMVRNIVGTLVGAGRGEFPPEKLAEILEGGDRTKAGRTAPSKGLFLEKIQFYEKQKRKA